MECDVAFHLRGCNRDEYIRTFLGTIPNCQFTSGNINVFLLSLSIVLRYLESRSYWILDLLIEEYSAASGLRDSIANHS